MSDFKGGPAQSHPCLVTCDWPWRSQPGPQVYYGYWHRLAKGHKYPTSDSLLHCIAYDTQHQYISKHWGKVVSLQTIADSSAKELINSGGRTAWQEHGISSQINHTKSGLCTCCITASGFPCGTIADSVVFKSGDMRNVYFDLPTGLKQRGLFEICLPRIRRQGFLIRMRKFVDSCRILSSTLHLAFGTTSVFEMHDLYKLALR